MATLNFKCVCVGVFVRVCDSLMSMLCILLQPSAPRIGSGSTATLTSIKCMSKMYDMVITGRHLNLHHYIHVSSARVCDSRSWPDPAAAQCGVVISPRSSSPGRCTPWGNASGFKPQMDFPPSRIQLENSPGWRREKRSQVYPFVHLHLF